MSLESTDWLVRLNERERAAWLATMLDARAYFGRMCGAEERGGYLRVRFNTTDKDTAERVAFATQTEEGSIMSREGGRERYELQWFGDEAEKLMRMVLASGRASNRTAARIKSALAAVYD